jgi:putative intracellular protease/amidase
MTNTVPCRVLILLPARDFDPSEVAVTWETLIGEGHTVAFATPDGQPAVADFLMLSGEGLDVWSQIPGLRKIKFLGLLLRANSAARRAYEKMQHDPAFTHPITYFDLDVHGYDGLVVPGGHRARSMRPFLEQPLLQNFVASFFDADRPVGAIGHGVVLAARSRSVRTGKSVLFGRKTTALPWKLEKSACSTMKFFGRWWDPAYYRTYTEQPFEARGYRSVEAEVTRALRSPDQFCDVPKAARHHFKKVSGLFRDSQRDSRAAWVTRDGKYVSGRWAGDVHCFAATLASVLAEGRTMTQPIPPPARAFRPPW